MNVATLIKTAVSGRRNRYRDGEFDLDLTYITPRLIAMGYPATALEGVIRNNIQDVSKYLNKGHKDCYMIFNLSERHYDNSLFCHRVVELGFPDHHSPPVEVAWTLCLTMDAWLQASAEHVAAVRLLVGCLPGYLGLPATIHPEPKRSTCHRSRSHPHSQVHCLAGKGRTGVICACYMLFSGYFFQKPPSIGNGAGPAAATGSAHHHSQQSSTTAGAARAPAKSTPVVSSSASGVASWSTTPTKTKAASGSSSSAGGSGAGAARPTASSSSSRGSDSGLNPFDAFAPSTAASTTSASPNSSKAANSNSLPPGIEMELASTSGPRRAAAALAQSTADVESQQQQLQLQAAQQQSVDGGGGSNKSAAINAGTHNSVNDASGSAGAAASATASNNNSASSNAGFARASLTSLRRILASPPPEPQAGKLHRPNLHNNHASSSNKSASAAAAIDHPLFPLPPPAELARMALAHFRTRRGEGVKYASQERTVRYFARVLHDAIVAVHDSLEKRDAELLVAASGGTAAGATATGGRSTSGSASVNAASLSIDGDVRSYTDAIASDPSHSSAADGAQQQAIWDGSRAPPMAPATETTVWVRWEAAHALRSIRQLPIPRVVTVRVTKLIINGVPNLPGGFQPVLLLTTAPYQGAETRVIYSSAWHNPTPHSYGPEDQCVLFNMRAEIKGDVLFTFRQAPENKEVFRFSLHSTFMASEGVRGMYRLRKADVDMDKRSKNEHILPDDFFLDIIYSIVPEQQQQQQQSSSNGAEDEDGAAGAAGSAAAVVTDSTAAGGGASPVSPASLLVGSVGTGTPISSSLGGSGGAGSQPGGGYLSDLIHRSSSPAPTTFNNSSCNDAAGSGRSPAAAISSASALAAAVSAENRAIRAGSSGSQGNGSGGRAAAVSAMMMSQSPHSSSSSSAVAAASASSSGAQPAASPSSSSSSLIDLPQPTVPTHSAVGFDADIQCSGWLVKRGSLVRNWKKRWFVLRRTALPGFELAGIGEGDDDGGDVVDTPVVSSEPGNLANDPSKAKDKDASSNGTRSRASSRSSDSHRRSGSGAGIPSVSSLTSIAAAAARDAVSSASAAATGVPSPVTAAESHSQELITSSALLYYYKSPTDTVPKGVIPLTAASVAHVRALDNSHSAYDVSKSGGRDHCFTIVRAGRKHYFQAENEEAMQRWMAAIADLQPAQG